MNENNFENLNEQQIAELYGDVLEEPTLIADCGKWDLFCQIGEAVTNVVEEVKDYVEDVRECAENTVWYKDVGCVAVPNREGL